MTDDRKKIDLAVEQLIDVLHESKEYKEYQEAKQRIKQWPELKRQLDEFRERNFMIQQKADDSHFMEEIERLDMEYAEFREDGRVHDFLKKEIAFCRLMQSVNFKVTESLEFD